MIVAPAPATVGHDSIRAMSVPMCVDNLAIRLNGQKASNKDWVFNLVFTDVDERYTVEVTNGVLHHTVDNLASDPTAALTITRAALHSVLSEKADVAGLIADGSIQVSGSIEAVGSSQACWMTSDSGSTS